MRKRARTDLCGGRSAMVVPTATVEAARSPDWAPPRARMRQFLVTPFEELAAGAGSCSFVNAAPSAGDRESRRAGPHSGCREFCRSSRRSSGNNQREHAVRSAAIKETAMSSMPPIRLLMLVLATLSLDQLTFSQGLRTNPAIRLEQNRVLAPQRSLFRMPGTITDFRNGRPPWQELTSGRAISQKRS